MDEFIETSEKIRPIGGTSMIYVGEEARILGLQPEETIGAVLYRPENREYVLSLLYGSNPYLFYIVAGSEDGTPFYEIRKALSERNLAHSLDYEPVAILGPFDSLPECRRFRDLLEEKKETDPVRLKELFKGFTE